MIKRKEAERRGIRVSDGATESVATRLNSLIPGAIDAEGVLNVEAIKEATGAVHSSRHGYELKFAGKFIARYAADLPTDKELRIEMEQSKDFDSTGNMVFQGDNLDVLKILKNNYYDSIDMIYIDPPYNTDNDGFVYSDQFKKSAKELIEELKLNQEEQDRLYDLYGTKTHSGWLALMYPRLKVARELLSRQGLIFVSINENELSNLRLIMDEIFGGNNFYALITWTARNKPMNAGKAKYKIQKSVEYVIAYGKIPMEEHTEFKLEEKKQKDYPHNDGDGFYRLEEVQKRKNIGIKRSEGMVFPILNQMPQPGYRWTISKQTAETLAPKGHIFIENGKVKRKIFKSEEDNSAFNPFWADFNETVGSSEDGKKELDDIIPNHGFETVKPTDLIRKLMFHTVGTDGLVLDFFAGTGTTGHTCMRLNTEDGGNRRFILVQLDEKITSKNLESLQFCKDNGLDPVISNITIERLKRAGNLLKQNHPQISIDTGYKVFSLKDKPKITDEGVLILDSSQRSNMDTLYNMMCRTGKRLDSRIHTIIESALYEVDEDLYMLKDVDIGAHEGMTINMNGWANISLERHLNLRGHINEDEKQINIIY